MSHSERDRFLKKHNIDVRSCWYDWRLHARPSQRPPADPDWVYWILQAGRGSGKTRAGAEWIRQMKDETGNLALVGATAADVRDVMVMGPAGLLSISPPDDMPEYSASTRRVIWKNGAQALLFSAEEPNRLRGPQHGACWADELAAWRYQEEAWQNLIFGLRLGKKPRCVITTTPRPTKLLRQLIEDQGTRVTRISSFSNVSHLAPSFFMQIIQRYEGTRLGRQEIEGELLEDVPGALWKLGDIDRDRLSFGAATPELIRIVVSIDPAMTSDEDSDETGIIVAGKDRQDHGYVLADGSGRYQPIEWAREAIAHFRQRKADRIVAEINNGGEMVEHTLRMVDDMLPITVVHATRGKVMRAEPVSALYEQGRVHHVGTFARLEDQMINFTQDWDRARDGSPDRLDALVWAMTELLVEPGPPGVEITDAMLRRLGPPRRSRLW